MNELQVRLQFLGEVEKLKTIKRANRTLDDRFENSAEHSWHVALMAILLKDYAKGSIDLLVVVKMLLIHDIVEIDAGDTWLYSEDSSNQQISEKTAADRIFGLLPQDTAIEYRKLWNEFEDRSSDSARYAAVIDGLQPLLNHLITGSLDNATIPVKMVLDRKAYIKDYAPDLWATVESLIDASVEKGLYV